MQPNNQNQPNQQTDNMNQTGQPSQPDNRAQSQTITQPQQGVPRVTMSTPGIMNPDGTQAEVPLNNNNTERRIDTSQTVQWQAREYIPAEKNYFWYIALFVIVAGVITLDVFIMKSWTVSVLAVVIAIVLVVISTRPARENTYTLDEETLTIDNQAYNLKDYKSFGVIHDGKENSLQLIPKKRFQPALSVYFPVDLAEDIVSRVGEHLPVEKIEPDFIDRLVRLLRL